MHRVAGHSYFKSLLGAGRLFEGAVLINLDSRPERLRRSLLELKRHGIDGCVTRMSAFQHENGMYGCSVSHLEAVRYARRKGWKSVLILEDDIKISADFAEQAPGPLGDLAEREWGLFQFGVMNPYRLEFVTPQLFRFGGAAAAHAFALHERTYDFLIEHYVCELTRGNWEEPAHLPFDEYLNNQLSLKFDAYGSTKLLISQYAGLSDTWNMEVDYRTELEESYEKIHVPPTRVRFAGSSVAIQWSRSEHGDLLRFLFGAACSDATGPVQSDLRIASDSSGKPALWCGAELLYAGDCEGALAQHLLEAVQEQLAGNGCGGLLLRAGALTVGSRAVILPGQSGAGKTSLVAALLSEQGHGYLTDELVFIPEGERRVSGLERPLGVKRSAQSGLAPSAGFDPQTAGVLHTPAGYLVAPEVFGSNPCDEFAELGLILFPAREAEGAAEPQRLSGAEAAVRLMDTLLNARKLPEHGFREIARLARNIPAFEVRGSDFGQLAGQLRTLFAQMGA